MKSRSHARPPRILSRIPLCFIRATGTQDFVDSLIAVARDSPEDALAIHHAVDQVRDLVPLLPTGILRLPIGYEVLLHLSPHRHRGH